MNAVLRMTAAPLSSTKEVDSAFARGLAAVYSISRTRDISWGGYPDMSPILEEVVLGPMFPLNEQGALILPP